MANCNHLRYIVIQGLAKDISLAHFCLTPQIMAWNDELWIFDLSPTLHYWQHYADDLESLLTKIIAHHFGEQVIAVYCPHPWQGLVLASALREQGRQGFFSFTNLFNQKLFRNVEWQHFWAPSDDLCRHLETRRKLGFQASHFRSKRGQMKRFVQRMMLAGPFALQAAEAQAIRRRFSALMGEMWRWTFYAVSPEQNSAMDLFSWANEQPDLLGFPWVNQELPEPPRQLRYLEHPITLWDHIEPLLKEDFAQLLQQTSYDHQARVTKILWQVTLYNLTTLDMTVDFRNPHDLAAEAPDFSTALYQAYYAFIDAMKTLADREGDLDLPEQIPFIGWQLIIKEQVYSPAVIKDLFADSRRADQQQICALENRLPTHLKRYQLAPDHLPELSFCPVKVLNTRNFPFATDDWARAAELRPLYYFPQPQKLTPPLANLQFLERVSNDWWRQNTGHFQRDYYLVRNDKKQIMWVFKDKEEWYQHGLFS